VQPKLAERDVTAVRALVDAVTAADGFGPLSEHVMLHLPGGGDTGVRHLLVRKGDQLVGYAHLDGTDAVAGSSAELAVHPSARRAGVGRSLVASLLEQSPDGRLRLWAHGDHPGAGALAMSMGFTRSRVLWQMRRELGASASALPEVTLPDGVEIRSFEVDQDEQAWTATNNAAFVDHPDQGRWGVEEVRLREQEAWFDPKGFFLAFRADRLVGFHWTKVHGSTAAMHPKAHGHDHPAVGEVYIVGVDPSEQGRGLGPALTLLGLHHLQDLGLDSVLLYVDEANTNAIRVYERLGFSRYATDVCWSLG